MENKPQTKAGLYLQDNRDPSWILNREIAWSNLLFNKGHSDLRRWIRTGKN